MVSQRKSRGNVDIPPPGMEMGQAEKIGVERKMNG
jgi:hypothetical protein